MTQDRDSEWIVIARRDFLRAGLGAAAVLVGCDRLGGRPEKSAARDSHPMGMGSATPDDPIAHLADGPSPRTFFGDEVQRFHEVLWDKAATLSSRGGLPRDPGSFERVRVCVVGGGLSGLSVAFLLKDLRPLVLEGATRLGGNAKAQQWGDLTYSIGSAYITNSGLDDAHMQMLKQLGLHERWRFDDPTHDRMYIGGTVHPEFWFGGTDRARAQDFVAAWNYFKQVRDSAYPDIPYLPDGDLSPEAFRALDERTFAAELQRGLGKQLHPHVDDVARQYSWSSFGADHTEISAAAGLNFLASDLGGMYVFPGGNAAISQALTNDLRTHLGPNALRSSLRVVDIRRAADGVRIVYVDRDNTLRTVLAEACVVATPKFVAGKLIDDLSPAQRGAMQQLTYRAYVVAHVLVDQPRPADFHDLYCIAGHAPAGTLRDEIEKRPFTDVVLATFADGGHPSRTVLNLYRGFPYEGARVDLFAPESYERHRTRIESALPVVLRALGLDAAKVRDVRLTRWGHPLVVPRPGLISSGVLAKASAPHQERIFFAQQDNYAMPAFESAFAAADDARARVRTLLGV